MSTARKPKRFGTFGGVFTPNVLCILGVISFLRTGWVVGNAGLLGGLVIVAVANAITLTTALSLSAIATNMRVKGGGAYYMVSRSLGLEIGGSIGIPLCLSQVLSIALYIIGFTESLMPLLPEGVSTRLVSTGVCVVLGLVSIMGAGLAIKIQYLILGALALAYGSFFAGGISVPETMPVFSAYEKGHGFWTVFAVFFPAVTGIMAGASMSGDLEEPQRSIPRGTLWAIGVTFVVYAAQMVWLAANAPREVLIGDKFIMRQVALFPPLIYAGVWCATLSSALASFVAAPRTMQALAKDRVLPGWLGRGSGEPRIAIVVTFAIAQACVLLGELDLIAPVITMFFLTTYGATNLAAGIEELVGNPSYRPAFSVHWAASLAGAAGCAYAMVLISPTATVVAAAATMAVYVVLRRRRLRVSWGDVRSGLWFSLARHALLKLQEHKTHPKNWRPNVMVFSGNPRTRRPLVDFADWLGEGRGIVTLCNLILSDAPGASDEEADAQRQIDAFIRRSRLPAFGLAQAVPDFGQGVCDLARLHQMAGLEHNVVLLGWSEEPSRRVEYATAVRGLVRMGKSVLLLKCAEHRPFGRKQRIDIWWGGRQNNGPLMALIAHMLRQNEDWSDAEVGIRMVTPQQGEQAASVERLESLVSRARIEAAPEVIVADLIDQPIAAVIAEHSADADLTLLGMNEPPPGEEEAYMAKLDSFVVPLKNALVVRCAGDSDILA